MGGLFVTYKALQKCEAFFAICSINSKLTFKLYRYNIVSCNNDYL